VIIPLSDLSSPAQIARINWQNPSENAQSTYYLDDVRLIGTGEEPPPPDGDGLTLNVDVTAARKPISAYIYGINEYGDADTPEQDAAYMQELGITVRRWGGNATSRYNWKTDISNHASDWYFGNVKESDATDLPNDSAVNRYINENAEAGTDSFIVMPLTGYVSNDNETACGFAVSKYGPQKATAAADSRPDCGNGVKNDGTLITGNNPLDASIAINPAFDAEWVNYLKGRYGSGNQGGVRFYNYDNEPDIWFETHRDVWPTGYKYDQFRDLTYQYGAAIKAADPTAALLGPAVNGWTYYFYSSYDGQREDWVDPDDRNAHGGMPFVPWYLQQMAAYEQQNGVRILDYLDLHYYPQSTGVSLSEAGSAATQALRLRSTRSLWDPAYADESWIPDAGPEGGIIQLIPRMRKWVADNYPGTKLAIGEYNWGGLEDINGALTQADVLGIFGHEGLDLATMWEPPTASQPGAYAFRIYRNYDKEGSKFGDTSVAAISSDQALLSVYAAQRTSDSALTLVIINKSGASQSAQLTVSHFSASGPAQLYRYSPASLNAILHGEDLALADGKVTATYPANSITLLVIPSGTPEPEPEPTFDNFLRLPMMSKE
jgi:hypothetical protein